MPQVRVADGAGVAGRRVRRTGVVDSRPHADVDPWFQVAAAWRTVDGRHVPLRRVRIPGELRVGGVAPNGVRSPSDGGKREMTVRDQTPHRDVCPRSGRPEGARFDRRQSAPSGRPLRVNPSDLVRETSGACSRTAIEGAISSETSAEQLPGLGGGPGGAVLGREPAQPASNTTLDRSTPQAGCARSGPGTARLVLMAHPGLFRPRPSPRRPAAAADADVGGVPRAGSR